MILKVIKINSYKEENKGFLDKMDWKKMTKFWGKANMFAAIALADA